MKRHILAAFLVAAIASPALASMLTDNPAAPLVGITLHRQTYGTKTADSSAEARKIQNREAALDRRSPYYVKVQKFSPSQMPASVIATAFPTHVAPKAATSATASASTPAAAPAAASSSAIGPVGGIGPVGPTAQ